MNCSETDRRNHAPDAFLDCYWGGDRYFRNPQYSRADWNHGGWSDRDDAVHPSLVWFAGWLDYTGAGCIMLPSGITVFGNPFYQGVHLVHVLRLHLL